MRTGGGVNIWLALTFVETGAYFAASCFGQISSVAQLDLGDTGLAVYGLYDSQGSANRVVVINTYFYNHGKRPQRSLRIDGLDHSITWARGRLLDAESAESIHALGQTANFGGVQFDNSTCQGFGTSRQEKLEVENGSLTITLPDSSAMLVELRQSY